MIIGTTHTHKHIRIESSTKYNYHQQGNFCLWPISIQFLENSAFSPHIAQPNFGHSTWTWGFLQRSIYDSSKITFFFTFIGCNFIFFCLTFFLMSLQFTFYFIFFNFYLFFIFYFTILYWFCHTSTCICHRCTCVPHPEPPSHLSPYTIPLGHPSAPAPSFLYPA